MSLKIGNIDIPDTAAFNLRQSYKEAGPVAKARARSGALIVQTRYRKLQSTISGNGWTPPGLDSLDPATAYAVHCIAPRSLSETDTSITIPHAYRTDGDYAPAAGAVVNGEMVATTVSMALQVATIGAVSGASSYILRYYPVLTAFVTVETDLDDDQQLQSFTIALDEQ